MNTLTQTIQAVHNTGSIILKGRSKGKLSKVLYKDKTQGLMCRVNGKIMPVSEFYKPFPPKEMNTEKQSHAKMLLLLLQKAEERQNELIKGADTPEEQRSMQKIMQNLSLLKGCAETLNLQINGIKI